MTRPDELSIGIVIPVYNEGAILEAALEHLAQTCNEGEVVVVDGGSRDRSAEIARRRFRTLVAPGSQRAAQMNLGAACLRTDVLLFAHADSRLPSGFEIHVRDALRESRTAGGCFRLAFDDPHPMLRFYCWWTRFPGRFLHFGDQCFFFRRSVFEVMGGYRELPFMEDVELLRRLRRHGRFAVVPHPVVTSARRFRQNGVVRQQLMNILLVALFELGVPATRLARLYPHVR